jgi:hypothetical protein
VNISSEICEISVKENKLLCKTNPIFPRPFALISYALQHLSQTYIFVIFQKQSQTNPIQTQFQPNQSQFKPKQTQFSPPGVAFENCLTHCFTARKVRDSIFGPVGGNSSRNKAFSGFRRNGNGNKGWD